MSGTIAQKVDTQARVIRSLNLIHCADTQHMVGAVELERLLNLEVENLELKRRIKRLEQALGLVLKMHNDWLEMQDNGYAGAYYAFVKGNDSEWEEIIKAKEAKP